MNTDPKRIGKEKKITRIISENIAIVLLVIIIVFTIINKNSISIKKQSISNSINNIIAVTSYE